MAVNRRGIVIEIVGDERSYLRAAERTIGANTKLDSSFRTVGVNAKASADAQVAAAVKASEALRVNALQMSAAATRLPAGGGRDAALVAAAAAQDRYNRSIGVTAVESARLSSASRTAERDLGKATRGTLAGATSALGLGRSLAFASGGFLAFAGGAKIIQTSIADAESLEKAQAGLAVAIEHTGGNLRKLEPQYAATAKSAQQFGIDQATATTGLERATVLTGSAEKAQRAYQEALVISKATGKDFNSVLTATSKGQEGITTSLQRYGIRIAKGTSGLQQFVTVMSRFGGQAAANTTVSDRFNATLANSEAIIGTALLPTFNRYVGEFGDWLQKMDRSGRLQKDVNSALHDAGDVFHTLGRVIGTVDKVTGGFKDTLELLLAIKAASLVSGWVTELTILAGKWGLVTAAATEAGAAETAALAGGAGAGVAAGAGGAGGVAAGAGLGALLAKLSGRGGTSDVVSRVGRYGAGPYTTAAATAAAADVGKSSSLLSKVGRVGGALTGAFTFGDQGEVAGTRIVTRPDGGTYREDLWHGKVVDRVFLGIVGKPVNLPDLRRGVGLPFETPGFGLLAPARRADRSAAPAAQGPFGAAQPIPVFKSFQLNVPEQLTQARAALTKANTDDVAAAKQVISRIKRLIDEGHLSGASLVQALQAEGSALSTIWSAEDATAQKRAQNAATAQARIQKQLENQIDPLSVEVGLSRAQALGRPIGPYLKALRSSAEKALAGGRLSLTQQKEAYDQIASLNQQIKEAATAATVTFTAPARLQLALAREQALGTSQTPDLLRLKAAIVRFIGTHKKNIGAEIDAYNQLASVNQQLGQSTTAGLGSFREASTRALIANLGLTAAQRKVLRARFSQLGPGGTLPGQGVGAFGYTINPKTDQPIHVHTRIDIDGKKVAENTTRHQQRRRTGKSSQTRGPNAGAVFGS